MKKSTITNPEEIQQYIESCECNKTRWNPFSEKKANCAIIKPKLAKLKEQERDTLVTNPLQKNNQYSPIPNQEEDYDRPSIYAPPPAAKGDWQEIDYNKE